MNDCYACATQRYNCRHSNVELFTKSELISIIADDMEGKEKSTRHALLRKLHDKVIPNEDMNQNLYGQGDSWKLEDMASIDLNTEGGANNTGEEYLASLIKAFAIVYDKDFK